MKDDDSLAVPIQPTNKHHIGRAFLVVLVSLLLAVVVSSGALVAYASWVGDRPIHGVSYLGTSLALLDAPTVQSVIESKNVELTKLPITIMINNQPVVVPLSEFSPTFLTQSAISAALPRWKNYSFIERAIVIRSTLWNGQAIPVPISLGVVPPKVLALTATSADAVDASFVWENNQVTVKPSVTGHVLDKDQLLADVGRSIVDVSKVTATFTPIEPKISTEALTALQPKAFAMVQAPLTVSGSGKTATYQPSDMISWLNPAVGLTGAVESTLDQAKIADSLVSIEKLVNKVAITKQVSAQDNSVIREGSAGVVMNRPVTAGLIATELEQRAKNGKVAVVAASIQTVAPTQETVQANSTPGLYAGKYIEVDLSTQQMFQYEGSTMVATRRVSTGLWSTPTPIGSFTINSKVPRAYSAPFGLYMPYWMAFIGSSYGIHELPEWPDGRKEGENHIGTPVSHGCIRLGVGEAQAVYDWAEIGTPVVVHA